jgi:hypothetical protein
MKTITCEVDDANYGAIVAFCLENGISVEDWGRSAIFHSALRLRGNQQSSVSINLGSQLTVGVE